MTLSRAIVTAFLFAGTLPLHFVVARLLQLPSEATELATVTVVVDGMMKSKSGAT